jgi:hypothetical protein
LFVASRIVVPCDGEKGNIGCLEPTELSDCVKKRPDARIRIVKHVSAMNNTIDFEINRVVDYLLERCGEVISPLLAMVLMIP